MEESKHRRRLMKGFSRGIRCLLHGFKQSGLGSLLLRWQTSRRGKCKEESHLIPLRCIACGFRKQVLTERSEGFTQMAVRFRESSTLWE